MKDLEIIIQNEKLEMDAFDLMVYCAIKFESTGYSYLDYKFHINILNICHLLCGNYNQNYKKIMQVKESLILFEKNKYIKIIDFSEYNFYIDCSSMWSKTNADKFIIISFSDYNLIKSCSIPQAEIFKTYLFILTTIYTSSKTGCFSQNKLAQLRKISKNTLIAHMKKLEELKMLYVKHSESCFVKRNANGCDSLIRLNNFYGKYEDKNFVDDYFQETKKSLNIKESITGEDGFSFNEPLLDDIDI